MSFDNVPGPALAAPQLYDEVSGVIGLTTMNKRGIAVGVDAAASGIDVGATITLHCSGTAVDGSLVEVVRTQRVSLYRKGVRFWIPTAQLQPLVGGSARFYYTVEGVLDQGQKSTAGKRNDTSKRRSQQVYGVNQASVSSTTWSATSPAVEVQVLAVAGYAQAAPLLVTLTQQASADTAPALSQSLPTKPVSARRAMGILATYDPIYIPGAKPVDEADGGINYNMAHSSVSGLLVYIPANPSIRAGYFIRVYWALSGDTGAPPVPVATIAAVQDGQQIQLFVPARLIEEGVCKVWYSVHDGLQLTHSAQLDILARFELPGGVDPSPETPVHEGLPLPVVPNDVIDKDAAKKGVVVTVGVYPNQRSGDTIQLSWGGYIVERVVTDPNQPTAVLVDERTILQAGDNVDLAVSYRLYDKVENVSAGWSGRSFVTVEASGDRLEEPALYDEVDGVIDLPSLAGEDSLVGVYVNRTDFAVGDVVTLHWDGKTAAGQPVTFEGSKIVTQVNRELEFSIPNLALLEIAQGTAVCYFSVTGDRAGVPYFARSRRVSVSILGEVPRMLAPTVDEAPGNVLPPASARARVVVPVQLTIVKNDVVHLYWLGTKADGGAWLHEQQRTVSDSLVGKEIPFTVTPTNIAVLEGGFVEVYYTIVHQSSSLTLESERLTLNVGESAADLLPPDIVEVVDGVLDPEGLYEVDVIINVYHNMRDGDHIFMYWKTESGRGDFSDSVDVVGQAVGKPVRFYIDFDVLEASKDEDVEVYFVVEHDGFPPRSSGRLSFHVGLARDETVDPPAVDGVKDGLLDPKDTPLGTLATVPASANLVSGDYIYLTWAGEGDDGRFEANHAVSGNDAGKAYSFDVPYRYIYNNLNRNVTVSYYIDRRDGGRADSGPLTFGVETSALPLPIITEASGTSQLNPDNVDQQLGASFQIAATALLKAGNEVTIYWERPGAAIYSQSKTISASEADRALVLRVPYNVVDASNGHSIAIRYTVNRGVGAHEESDANSYDVARVIGSGRLKLLGARYTRSVYRYSGASSLLSAFDANTGRRLSAEWKYLDQTTWVRGETFRDTDSQTVLQVRSADDIVTLNPANIIGNGADTTVTGTAAFVAHRNGGDLTTWGHASYGGSLGASEITISDVVEVSMTGSACCARRKEGQVFAWGTATMGGNLGTVSSSNFKEVVAGGQVFAGIKNDGTVVAWGTAALGGTVPASVPQDGRVIKLYGSGVAFAARLSNNSVVGWGTAAQGGTVPAPINGFTDIVDVIGSYQAFAALRRNVAAGVRRVVAWGGTAAGAVPAAIAAVDDVERLLCASAHAFVVQRATGHILAWGISTHGGALPTTIDGFTDIVEVVSTWQSFCALRHTANGEGRIVAWGGSNATGGVIPPDLALIDDYVQVAGTATAFAALRQNGTVVAWGAAGTGGSIPAATAPLLVNVVALYSNTHAFTALTADGRVVTWGHAAGGGNSTAQQPALTGKVGYIATQQSRSVALSASRRASSL